LTAGLPDPIVRDTSGEPELASLGEREVGAEPVTYLRYPKPTLPPQR